MDSFGKIIFITGASGFIGPMILKDLLLKNYSVVCLMRESDLPAKERLKKILQKAEIQAHYLNKITILMGDVSEKNFGLDENTIRQLRGNVSEVWHLAASLSFRRRDRSKNFLINLDGTKNTVNFSKNIGTKHFFYISTVYIRGNETGTVYEKSIKKSQKFTNSYEETKWEAENYVISALETEKIGVVIFRPSIVVGDERYTPEQSFGYYNFLKTLSGLKNTILHLPKIIKYGIRIIGIRIKDNHIHSKLPFLSSGNKSLNLIPIRDLVYLISKISDFHRSQQGIGVSIYNLVDPKPMTIKVLFGETLRGLGFYLPIISMPGFILNIFFKLIIWCSAFIPQLKPFSRSLFYYKQYILNEAQYDTTNTKKIVGNEFGSDSLLTVKKLRGIIRGFQQK